MDGAVRGSTLGFPEAIRLAFRSYARGRGRATRAEYWWFYLFTLIGWTPGIPIVVLGSLSQSQAVIVIANVLWALWLLVYCLGIVIPAVTVTVRRLHDTGKSAHYLWFHLLPFAGAVVVLVLLLLPSDAGTNAYGPPRSGH